MPLFPNAISLIRANLVAIERGERVRLAVIGTLTDEQLATINRTRAAHSTPLPPITAEVIFFGSHIYRSRVIRDGYSIDDVLDQITGAMDAAAEFIETLTMTAIQNPTPRADRYGNMVYDRAIFECTTRHPRPELFSVMPKGDVKKPPK